MYLPIIITIVAAFFLTGCGFRKKEPIPTTATQLTRSIETPQADVIPQKYIIEVGDVECDLCAHAVENIIAGIPGVQQVNYEHKNGNYEKGRLKVTVHNETSLTEKNLTALLTDNGFVFRKMAKA